MPRDAAAIAGDTARAAQLRADAAALEVQAQRDLAALRAAERHAAVADELRALRAAEQELLAADAEVQAAAEKLRDAVAEQSRLTARCARHAVAANLDTLTPWQPALAQKFLRVIVGPCIGVTHGLAHGRVYYGQALTDIRRRACDAARAALGGENGNNGDRAAASNGSRGTANPEHGAGRHESGRRAEPATRRSHRGTGAGTD